MTPLIQNNFSQKSIEQMLRKHMGFSNQREAKVPSKQAEAAKVLNRAGRVCIPPTAFKKAMLTASMQVKDGAKKTQLRTQLFIVGSSVPITYESAETRMDMVRTAGIGRQPDVRFRPQFNGWKARMEIVFAEPINADSVIDLLNRAGNVGVQEWRPEKDGTFGTFCVSRANIVGAERDTVREECRVELVGLKIPDWAMDAELTPELIERIGATGRIDDAAHEQEEEAAQ